VVKIKGRYVVIGDVGDASDTGARTG
jgi:hypothetical protein